MLIKICSIKINPPLQPKRGRGILLLFCLNKKIAHALIFFVSELTTVDGILIPTVPQNNISVHKVSVINLSSSLLSWDEGGKTRYPVTSCFLYTLITVPQNNYSAIEWIHRRKLKFGVLVMKQRWQNSLPSNV